MSSSLQRSSDASGSSDSDLKPSSGAARPRKRSITMSQKKKKKKSRNTPHWLETLTSCETMAAPLKQERLSNTGLQLSPESFGQTPAARCAENIRRLTNIKQSSCLWNLIFFMLGWNNNNNSRSVGLMHVFASDDPQFYGERRLELYCLSFVHGEGQKITQCNNPECLSLPPTF